jgi:DNA-binding MarR family transcriptional regulator
MPQRVEKCTDASNFIKVLSALRARDINGIHQALILMHVAHEPGLTIQDYADRTGASQQVASAHILELGPRKRNGGEGLGLIEIVLDPQNLRRHLVYLTSKGRTVVRSLQAMARIDWTHLGRQRQMD